MFWRSTIWWFGLVWLWLLGCQNPPNPARVEQGPEPAPASEAAQTSRHQFVRRSRPMLGTFVTISIYAPRGRSLDDAFTAAFSEFDRVDRLMSLHRLDSELSRVNAGAARSPMPISDELFQVLEKAQEIARITEGAFDITIRPIADRWGFPWKLYRLPEPDELAAVMSQVDFRLVQLDRGSQSVRFAKPGVSIDLGGIAKGFAVDAAVARLDRAGVRSALVKAGGDLRVLGLPPGRRFWEIQLEDPAKQGRRTVVQLRAGSLSTSGNYENFFIVNGRRYGHILDPRTGWPVEGIGACTVTAPTCMESDVLATAFYVFGVKESLARFGDRVGIRFVLPPRPGETNWVIFQSKHFP